MRKIFALLLLLLTLGCTAHRPLCGGYTRPRALNKEEKELFAQTYRDSIPLTPVRVSTQVVAGTNYAFRCRDRRGHRYEVTIFQALPCYGGKAEVTQVSRR